MTAAVVLAGGAGVVAAGGLVDAAAVLVARRTASTGARRGWLRRVLMRLGHHVGVPAAPRDLAERLAAAGTPIAVTPADVMAAKAGAGVAAALAAAPLAAALPLRLGVIVFAVASVAAFFGPDLVLRQRARRRAARAALELADVLDLLRVVVEAGLPVGRAVAEVAQRRGGLVAAELGRAVTHMDLGLARSEALTQLRRRLPLPAIAALVAAIERADRHGAPLAPALAALAEETRAERGRRLRDHAAAAAPRIQLAVALLLVPAVMLLVAAGLVHGFA